MLIVKYVSYPYPLMYKVFKGVEYCNYIPDICHPDYNYYHGTGFYLNWIRNSYERLERKLFIQTMLLLAIVVIPTLLYLIYVS